MNETPDAQCLSAEGGSAWCQAVGVTLAAGNWVTADQV